MLFNTLQFVVFLSLVFTGYWFIFDKNLRWQNLFLAFVSFVFYVFWDWRFCVLLLALIVWSYGIAYFVVGRRWLFVLGCVVALLPLAVFKYLNFFVDSMVSLLKAVGLNADVWTLRIILPIGISFYTFQMVGYLTDVYKNKVSCCKDFAAYAASVVFFPKLAMGPIESAKEYIPQFLDRRHFSYPIAVDGCRQILWGAFKKMVVADGCAPLIRQIWEYAGTSCLSGSEFALGAVLQSFQLYADFSGYSDMAIGLGKLFGVRLTRNFACPYFASNIGDFWRRWHMSLMRWFRDYIYIPLGGSRCSQWRHIRNVMVVFMVSGLWHGANWTFLLWGLVHAVLFIPLLFFGKSIKALKQRCLLGRVLISLGGMTVTFSCVTLAWILFNAQTLAQAMAYYRGIFSPSLFSIPHHYYSAFPGIAIMLGTEFISRDQAHGLSRLPKYKVVRWILYVIFVVCCLSNYRFNSTFVYFDF